MSVETDSRGRLYLPSEIREQYGEKFHVVEYENRLELIPIDDDPLQAIHDAVGDAFADMSIDELREQAREQAKQDADADFEDERPPSRSNEE